MSDENGIYSKYQEFCGTEIANEIDAIMNNKAKLVSIYGSISTIISYNIIIYIASFYIPIF